MTNPRIYESTNIRIKALLLFVVLGGGLQALMAQQNSVAAVPGDTAIYPLFRQRSDLRWIKRYSARFDDALTAEVMLGYDGVNCRGYLSHPKSRTRFRLDGTLTGANLLLKELDPQGEVTGYLRGTYNGRLWTLDWTNYDNTVGSRLTGVEIGATQRADDYCGDNKWVNRYAGQWNNQAVECVLARSHDGRLQGYAWFAGENRQYDLKGRLDDVGQYQLTATGADGRAAGQIKGLLNQLQITEAEWVAEGRDDRALRLTLQQNLLVGCSEFADYVGSLDALYPKTRCTPCNAWFEQQITTWVNQAKAVMVSKGGNPSPATRNSLRGTGWVEITCWNNDIFSGHLTFTNNWGGPEWTEPFSFDLKKGHKITVEDLFVRSFDFRAWMQQYARSEMPKLSRFASDPGYRAWLAQGEFQLASLRYDGLALVTKFHPVYGREQIVAPYRLLVPYFKKNTPLESLLR
jgi:hypothetical protein